MMEERKRYGLFYYRFPHGGESCADVYDRQSSFLERLYRSWEAPKAEPYVIVCHSITARVFLMRLLKASVDEFYCWDSLTNCEMIVLTQQGPQVGRLSACI